MGAYGQFNREERIMNIGAELILLPFAVLSLIIGSILKRKKSMIGTWIIIVGLWHKCFIVNRII
jgi:hypothetical protein